MGVTFFSSVTKNVRLLRYSKNLSRKCWQTKHCTNKAITGTPKQTESQWLRIKMLKHAGTWSNTPPITTVLSVAPFTFEDSSDYLINELMKVAWINHCWITTNSVSIWRNRNVSHESLQYYTMYK